jgi:hypothetical protein
MTVNQMTVDARANLGELILHNRNSHGWQPHGAFDVVARFL